MPLPLLGPFLWITTGLGAGIAIRNRPRADEAVNGGFMPGSGAEFLPVRPTQGQSGLTQRDLLMAGAAVTVAFGAYKILKKGK